MYNKFMRQEKSCGCIVINDGKVLIEAQKHKDEVFWNFPKGHQESFETDTETALRETKEEVGLDVKIIDTNPIVMKYFIDKGTTEKTVLLFLSELAEDSDGKITLQDDEVAETKWVPFAEADKIFTFERSRVAWQEALSRLHIK